MTGQEAPGRHGSANKLPCGCGGVSSPHSGLETAAPDAINSKCHGFLGGVTAHDKHVVPVPQIVLVYWDQYFTDTPGAVTTMNQFVSDLATGGYWSALSQYGVGAATLAASAVINMTSFPTPNSQHPGQPFSERQMQDQLHAWLDRGRVTPRPAGDEKNLVYLIFAPSDTTLTLGGASDFCGYHQHGRFNATTSRDNLTWGTVRGFSKPAGTSAGQAFVDSISFCVTHELSEAFSNPDGRGFFNDGNGCEIGDICEADKTRPCCITVPYTVSGRTWMVEQYWSNLDARCLIGPTTWLPGRASQLDGYTTSWNGQQHVNYVAGDASIHELIYSDRWGNRVLTVAAQRGSAVRAPAGHPAGGVPDGVERAAARHLPWPGRPRPRAGLERRQLEPQRPQPARRDRRGEPPKGGHPAGGVPDGVERAAARHLPWPGRPRPRAGLERRQLEPQRPQPARRDRRGEPPKGGHPAGGVPDGVERAAARHLPWPGRPRPRAGLERRQLEPQRPQPARRDRRGEPPKGGHPAGGVPDGVERAAARHLPWPGRPRPRAGLERRQLEPQRPQPARRDRRGEPPKGGHPAGGVPDGVERAAARHLPWPGRPRPRAGLERRQLEPQRPQPARRDRRGEPPKGGHPAGGVPDGVERAAARHLPWPGRPRPRAGLERRQLEPQRPQPARRRQLN